MYGNINYNYDDGYLKKDFNRLKGVIEELEQFDYKFSENDVNGKINYPTNRTGKYLFNSQGQIVYKSDYNGDFKPRFERWYLDYSKGLVLKQIEHKENEQIATQNKYNTNLIISSQVKNSIETVYPTQSKFDTITVETENSILKYSKSNLVEKFLKPNKVTIKYEYHPNGIRKSSRSFDWKNRMVSEKVYNKNKELLSQTTISHRFSEYLKKVEVSAFRTLYQYDNKPIDKTNISNITFPVNESISKIENGLTVESGGQTYKYDNKNNLIAIFDEYQKPKSTFKYEYDEVGNWIKRIEYINESPFRETVRKIKYRKVDNNR